MPVMNYSVRHGGQNKQLNSQRAVSWASNQCQSKICCHVDTSTQPLNLQGYWSPSADVPQLPTLSARQLFVWDNELTWLTGRHSELYIQSIHTSVKHKSLLKSHTFAHNKLWLRVTLCCKHYALFCASKTKIALHLLGCSRSWIVNTPFGDRRQLCEG